MVDEDPSVSLELSGAEALVLFELLSRWSDGPASNVGGSMLQDPAGTKHMNMLFIDYQAERRVLGNILAMLQSTLVEPFEADYVALLSEAREALQDEV